MQKWMEIIETANEECLFEMMNAIRQRYEQLQPGWQIHVLTLYQDGTQKEQINNIIQLLRHIGET